MKSALIPENHEASRELLLMGAKAKEIRLEEKKIKRNRRNT